MVAVMEDVPTGALEGHAAWSEAFNELFAQVAGAFENAAVRWHGRGYMLGLLSRQERKNSWWLAELAGDASPDGKQRLLNFSPWDEDAARDALAQYVSMARRSSPRIFRPLCLAVKEVDQEGRRNERGCRECLWGSKTGRRWLTCEYDCGSHPRAGSIGGL
jgi:hypothetical protein